MIAFRNDGISCLCQDGWEGYHCEFKEGEVPKCDLQCANQGTCVVGIRSSTEVGLLRRIWSDEEISDHMQCVCPTGFGGPLCESSSEECGSDDDDSSFCYHGGTCVTTTTTIHGKSTTEYHCDCTTATDSQGNRFAGDYCQEISTAFCDDKDDSLFCTTGGSCHPGGDPIQLCHCPDGFSGHKCEYDTRPPPIKSDDTGTDDEEEPSEPCGDIFCLNGSKCISRDFVLEDGTQGSEEVCDCTTAHKPALYQAFAGDACQYKSTSICDSSSSSGEAGDEFKFCVNGGTCDDSASTSYCTCPISFTGLHCEIHTKEHQTSQDPTCSDTVCYNGGKCVETKVVVEDEDGGSTTSVEQYCDCQSALDQDHIYAGRSCEYKSTSLCTEPANEGGSLEGLYFCANHGTCYQNIQQGCKCLVGFDGFHCEFLALAEDPNGTKDDEESSQAAIDASTEECGDLICKNGGTCVTSVVKGAEGQASSIRHVQHCDCSTTATATSVFAGLECEHEATEFCTEPEDGSGLETAIFCVQGGKCNSNVFQGCDCSAGWTGFRCEFAMDLDDMLGDSSSDGGQGATECGDRFCHHGGVCEVAQEVNDDTGELADVYSCDCSTTATGSEIYGGPTCSFKSTSVCQQPERGSNTLATALFCFNHGTCREDPLDGCDCPSGFTGSHCQFEVDDSEHSDLGEVCGGGFCYNGGHCVTTKIIGPHDDTTIEFHCDCSSAFDDTNLYAGNSCQYKSTSQCSHPREGDSLLGSVFCVNEGTCNEDFLQGCECPSGWTGFFCEYEEDREDIYDDTESTQDAEPCGDNVCLNGGTCVSTLITAANGTKTTIQYCDCNTAYNKDTTFAGANCEYPATTLCTEPKDGAPDLAGVDFCVNGGKCNEDNLFGGCICDDRHWAGMRCELKRDDFEDDESVSCGNIACFNGGQCVVSVENDIEDYSCDCSSAFDDLHRYDGPYCQYQSTELCSKPQAGGTLAKVEFCVNEGHCQDGGPCLCMSGFFGPRCELTIYEGQDSEDVSFNQDDDEYTYNCRLTCFNGGTCAKGVKDLGSYEDAIGKVGHLNKTYDETLFEHCVCPEGYVGLTCEHKVETCGNDAHYCLHGSTCVEDDGRSVCDCSQADETIIGHGDQPLFAGDSCEHAANDICVQGDAFPTRPLYFCVNGGTCRSYVSQGEQDPGCDCKSGWAGPHCETRTNHLSAQSASPEEGADILLISMVTATLVLLLLILVASLMRLGKPSSNENAQDWVIFRRRGPGHGLSDDPTSRSSNLAPKRCSTIDSLPAKISPRSDPGQPLPYQDDPILERYEDEPVDDSLYHDEPNVIENDYSHDEIMVDVGPSRDEDGHQLHNVDFI